MSAIFYRSAGVSIFREFKCRLALMPLFVFTGMMAASQQLPSDTLKTDSLKHGIAPVSPVKPPAEQYDIGDLAKDIFHPHRDKKPSHKKPSGITVIPNIAANPTIGAQLGIKAVAGKKLGQDPNTLMSVAATSASVTTKGIIYFYINHNVYTNANKWNLQGNLVVAKTVTPDVGLGIGNTVKGSDADLVLANANRKVYVLHSLFFNFREKVYKEVSKNLFLGAGLSFDIRRNIEDRKSTTDLTLTIFTQTAMVTAAVVTVQMVCCLMCSTPPVTIRTGLIKACMLMQAFA